MTAHARHEAAMALADRADAANRRVRALFLAASVEEEEAAKLSEASEPSRSILYRSAAWLALNAGDPARALELARRGLRRSVLPVPPAIAAELRAVGRVARATMRATR